MCYKSWFSKIRRLNAPKICIIYQSTNKKP